ncbi:MAG: phosphoenolpyruvate synthase [Muribaculaceae bacterium]|nr:phosphoenolpyruvate synthase [Muribaculaceae bacterium]
MNEEALSRMYLKETSFQSLMQHRIFNVLLVASPYDAFIIEEDGRVEEQLYNEYVSLNLSSPPRVTRVSTMDEGIEMMTVKPFDLVIAMPGSDIADTFTGAVKMKAISPLVPIVVLTPFSKEVSRRLASQDFSGVDYVFSWLGNMDLILAIIKLLEDKLNADDISDVGVQMIMLVEDSVRFYSSVLPHVYKFLLKQSKEFSTEALNQHEQMLRMRGRPKVMLARNYEEAEELYKKYGHKMLGIISDVSFNHNGAKDREAGLKLARWIRNQDPFLPIIIESSETVNAGKVGDFGGIFIDKNSKKLSVDLGAAISDYFGFGDFIFRDPVTHEAIMTIHNLKELQQKIFDIPADSLLFHASRNDISRWLYSRALFPIADVVKLHHFTSVEEAPAVKRLFFDLIIKYRKMKNRGVVAVFKKDRFDHYSNFARIGQGSLGGKGRGLAFIDSIIKKNSECDNFDGLTISIPRTVVLCTDVFDEFMSTNDLYPIALSDASDREILDAFLAAKLPEHLLDDIQALLDVVDTPFAVRSSSLLEDSHYQPFAGIYATYMVPYSSDCIVRLHWLADAIKGVYASVFYAASKTYMTATSNVIDQEKMAVIIQEVVGIKQGDYYFPSFSGVGRSLNYYPVGDEKADDGVVEIAVGLGKYIVDGGRGLRFSPQHPEHALQTSTLDLALRDTQTKLFAIKPVDENDLNSFSVDVDEGTNLTELNVQKFASTGALRYMVSTFDTYNGMLKDYEEGNGRRVVTFANILRDKVLPVSEALAFMLREGQTAMQRPIEIEFAGTILPRPTDTGIKGHLYWLQIRPIIDRKNLISDTVLRRPDEQLILRTETALGNGLIEGVRHIVYVKPEGFDSMANRATAETITRINKDFAAKGEGYVLIGPGRWGSSDSALGIPVRWADIHAARLIVEASLPGYRIEPSQGTHFFQNLTSFGVGYFTIDQTGGQGFYDSSYLDSLPAIFDDGTVRIVEFEEPLSIAINGRSGLGTVLKPAFAADDTTIETLL